MSISYSSSKILDSEFRDKADAFNYGFLASKIASILSIEHNPTQQPLTKQQEKILLRGEAIVNATIQMIKLFHNPADPTLELNKDNITGQLPISLYHSPSLVAASLYFLVALEASGVRKPITYQESIQILESYGVSFRKLIETNTPDADIGDLEKIFRTMSARGLAKAKRSHPHL